ncbi:murein biosynthesis integral membrane protein MurJ [Eggerthellaceae bacterium zg-1084]|uniref:Murein biosynthesis integral membrane protein MurJ n=2 Tax=Berryella wangjianweii TaxID=2734634 RepID=A0A6M8IYQ4_9ACTN|nr:murein biosynthesis integral membrane protein MurJ [Berryella wangjianweii]NPD33035.1 murein biosynthesis integral membrane protein MurJ [Eggerthellaceae bacterium zg-997]QKF08075.1 murein biosynthesis integral membrane protein MurJ [Berryella wangjianweii]
MTVATLGSRATGLIRTWVMAFALGNTFVTSAYQVANNMPNVIFELVAGGLLAAAFLPTYLSQIEEHGARAGNRFASNLLNLFIVVLGLLSVLAAVFAPQVIATQTFTVGDSAEVTELAVQFFRIFAVQVLFYGVSGVITGILNANRVYFITAIAPALNNIVVIAAFLAYIPLSQTDAQLAIAVLAIGTSIGVAVQAVIQIPALAKVGFRWSPRLSLADPALREAVRIAVPTLVYVVGSMVAFSCRNAFSLQAGDEGPSTLIYAWTWFQLPYGVLIVSFARPLFTEMSAAAARFDWVAFRRFTRQGIAITVVMAVPFMGLMAALAPSIISLFRAGAFSADDVTYVSSILALWALSLPLYSVTMLLYNVYASLRRFWRFALVCTALVAVQCGLYAVLCSPEVLGLYGVPVADFVYYGTTCVMLTFMLENIIGSFGIGRIASSAARITVASALGTAAAWGLSLALPDATSIGMGMLRLVICGSLGLAISLALAFILRIPEMSFVKPLFAKVGRRLKRAR